MRSRGGSGRRYWGDPGAKVTFQSQPAALFVAQKSCRKPNPAAPVRNWQARKSWPLGHLQSTPPTPGALQGSGTQAAVGVLVRDTRASTLSTATQLRHRLFQPPYPRPSQPLVSAWYEPLYRKLSLLHCLPKVLVIQPSSQPGPCSHLPKSLCANSGQIPGL